MVCVMELDRWTLLHRMGSRGCTEFIGNDGGGTSVELFGSWGLGSLACLLSQ
jgi:hypothetical protein